MFVYLRIQIPQFRYSVSRLIPISEATTLAIHNLVLIASSTIRLNAKKNSEILHVSQNHLSKILQILAKNEYLELNRGPGGGFTFNKHADQIRSACSKFINSPKALLNAGTVVSEKIIVLLLLAFLAENRIN